MLGLMLPLLGLAACGSTPTPRAHHGSRDVPPTVDGAACIVDMLYRNAAFNRLPDTGKAHGCGIPTAISLRALEVPLNRPVRTDCALARQVMQWTTSVVEPTAQRIFGQPLREIQTYGSYACRGRTSNRSRLSEHAYGKALDVAGFTLADGRHISVLHGWSAGGDEEKFLHSITQGACPYFSVVLSPNSDSDHANHLHLDIGPWKLCSP